MRILFVAAALAMLATRVRAQELFVPGHIFVSEIGSEGCLAQRNWIREIDPTSGQSWLFAEPTDGLCSNSGLQFTPDGTRLRVLNLGSNNILDFAPDGSHVVAMDGSDGLWGPFGRNGLAWDGVGNFYVANHAVIEVQKYPVGGGGPIVLLEFEDGISGAGGLAVAPNGDLYFARHAVWCIPVNGEPYIFDPFENPPPRAHTIAIDRRGNIFVGASASLYRYDDGLLSRKRLLASGFITSSETIAITLSADEQVVYLADHFSLYAIDAQTGASQLLFAHPSDQVMRTLGWGIAVYIPNPPGDVNCDRRLDFFDIDPFLLALFDPPGYAARFSFCRIDLADMNADGSVNFLDIDGFIAGLFLTQP